MVNPGSKNAIVDNLEDQEIMKDPRPKVNGFIMLNFNQVSEEGHSFMRVLFNKTFGIKENEVTRKTDIPKTDTK